MFVESAKKHKNIIIMIRTENTAFRRSSDDVSLKSL
mgnify:CR=1 FL=1